MRYRLRYQVRYAINEVRGDYNPSRRVISTFSVYMTKSHINLTLVVGSSYLRDRMTLVLG